MLTIHGYSAAHDNNLSIHSCLFSLDNSDVAVVIRRAKTKGHEARQQQQEHVKPKAKSCTKKPRDGVAMETIHQATSTRQALPDESGEIMIAAMGNGDHEDDQLHFADDADDVILDLNGQCAISRHLVLIKVVVSGKVHWAVG